MALQRGDHALLLLGCDAPEDRLLVEDVGELGVIVRQVPRIEALGDVEAHLSRDGGDRAGVVPRDDPDADLLPCEVRERLGSVGAHLLAEREDHDRDDTAGEALGIDVVVGESGIRMPEHEGAAAALCERGDRASELGSSRCRRVAEDHLRRAHHPGSCDIGEGHGTPLPRRGEGDVAVDDQRGLDRVRLLHRSRGRIRIGRSRVPGQDSGRGFRARRGQRVEGVCGVEPDLAHGERARLVETHHVDAGEAFDRGQLVHEHLPPRQPRRPDGEGDARHQDQSERDHGRERCDRVHDRLHPGSAREHGGVATRDDDLGVEDEQADRSDDPADPLQHPVDR